MENIKKLLKDNDLVEFKNGKKAIYFNKGFSFTDGTYGCLLDYNNNLEATINNNYDIIKILRLETFTKFTISIIKQKFNNWNIIWERKEKTIDVTIAEIEEKFGYKVRIIDNK